MIRTFEHSKPKSRVRLALFGLATLLSCHFGEHAAAGADLETWIRERFRQSAEWMPSAEAGWVEYSLSWGEANPARLAELKPLVEGKLEHPLRAEYESLLKWATSGPDVVRYRFLRNSDSAWRLTSDRRVEIAGEEQAAFWDVGRADDVTWSLVPSQLRGGVAGSGTDCDYSTTLDDPRWRLRLFKFQVVASAGETSPTELRVVQHPTSAEGHWRVRVRWKSGFCIDYLGDVDAATGSFAVRENRVVAMGDAPTPTEIDPAVVGGGILFQEPRHVPGFGDACTLLRHSAYGNVPACATRLIGTTKVDQAARVAALGIPVVGADDLLRGVIQVASVVDRTPDGRLTRGLEGVPFERGSPTMGAASTTKTLMWFGWVSLGGLFALFLYIRKRSARVET